MLIIAIIAVGLLVGGLAQMVLGRSMATINWSRAFACGLLGSLVGGLVISLLLGDGLEVRPAGLIGSIAGAILVTVVWERSKARAT